MRSRFTNNQERAVALAGRLVADGGGERRLEDADWHLLLLAGGLSGIRVYDSVGVAERVLDHARRRAGYFAHSDPTPQRPGTATEWPGWFDPLRRPDARPQPFHHCPDRKENSDGTAHESFTIG